MIRAFLLAALLAAGIGQDIINSPNLPGGRSWPVNQIGPPVPFVRFAQARSVGVTNTSAVSIVNVTTGAADATYMLFEVITITSGTTFSFSGVYDYTNENNSNFGGSVLDFDGNGQQYVTVMTNAFGNLTWAGRPQFFRAKGGTAIRCGTNAGTFTNVVYNIECQVFQLVG